MSSDPRDLELRIVALPEQGKYQVLTRSPSASHVFMLPAPLLDLQHSWAWRSTGGQDDPAQEIGASLFRALFSGEIKTAFKVAGANAEGGGNRLRVRLELGAAGLAALPWELLWDPEEGVFLFKSRDNSLVRTLATRHKSRPLKVDGRLRMLLVKSAPKNLPHLELDKEIRGIRAALTKLTRTRSLTIDLVEPDPLKIEQRLAQRQYHIVHFLGHGRFVQGGGGELFLEDEAGASRPAGYDLIGELLKHESVRLVVLNACEGARSSRENPFSGVATRLAQFGVPAVIAMQCPMDDRTAVSFAEQFYTHLAATGRPGQALSLTRRALSLSGGASWATPALYLQAPDGQLFDPKALGSWPWIWEMAAGLASAVVHLTIAVPILLWLVHRLWQPTPPPPEKPSPECPSPPGVNLVFVEISPGRFWMGSDHDGDDAKPPHEVTISKPFCLGAYEVTQEQYKKVMTANPSRHRGNQLPVENVSWDEAQQFLAMLRAREPGAHYRLATEAEWEYGARGRSSGSYALEDNVALVVRNGNCSGIKGKMEVPVGSFEANSWHLHDMSGNVSEWVQDWFATYGSEPAIDPTGPATGRERVRRGGSFRNSPANCSAVMRNHSEPNRSFRDVGFRVVRDPVPAPARPTPPS